MWWMPGAFPLYSVDVKYVTNNDRLLDYMMHVCVYTIFINQVVQYDIT